MIAAEGILTARGGVSSHAALVARQMGKVCVCGASALEVDYQKRIVSVDGQTHTFNRDGNCIEEPRQIFGKLCKGGKSGEAANVSTRNVPTKPAGIWVATNADGEFKLEFKPGNRLAMTLTPAGGQPDTQEGTFTIEGDVIYATLAQSTPMVLKFVNDAYESTSFGLPMKFVRQ